MHAVNVGLICSRLLQVFVDGRVLQGKMRAMLEDLRKNLGMPPEQDVHSLDFGYRSTLSTTDLENRYNRDVVNDVSVEEKRSVSPPRPTSRPSPLRSNSRPPLPRFYNSFIQYYLNHYSCSELCTVYQLIPQIFDVR